MLLPSVVGAKHAKLMVTGIMLLQLNCTVYLSLGHFHTLAFDLIAPINSPSKCHIWILAIIKYYTKWVEVVTLKRANAAVVANFIRDNIICRSDYPKLIPYNNGIPFVTPTYDNFVENMVLIISSSALTILKGMVKPRPPTKLYCEFLA